MCEHEVAGGNETAQASTTEGKPRATTTYRQPRLVYVGSIVGLVQSGPVGNRYETYQGSYWSDR